VNEPESRIAIKRAYEPRARGDGTRVLVDRLWPRGLRKSVADFDQWRKDLSPSTELRQFYGHRPELFFAFTQRYRTELRRRAAVDAIAEIIELANQRTVTLLTASRDLEHSEAAVLADHLRAIIRRRSIVRKPS
jgi:uncharacterized protein YeaO (DUF488 family)